jgi:hypothetical protein
MTGDLTPKMTNCFFREPLAPGESAPVMSTGTTAGLEKIYSAPIPVSVIRIAKEI